MPIVLVGKLVSRTQGPPSASGPQTKTAYWGDNAKGDGGYIPADSQPSSQGVPSDPNWEAPLSAWSKWDTGKFGDLPMPGLVRWRIRKAHSVDAKKAKGQSGATPTLLGFEPAEVDLTFQMWTRNHLQQYEAMVAMFTNIINQAMAGASTPKGAGPDSRGATAFAVTLPALNIVGINSLYLLVMGVPEPSSTPQMFQATFKFQEFSPIKTNENSRRMTSAQAQPSLGAIGNSLDQNTSNVPAEPNTKPTSYAP